MIVTGTAEICETYWTIIAVAGDEGCGPCIPDAVETCFNDEGECARA